MKLYEWILQITTTRRFVDTISFNKNNEIEN